MIIQIRCNSLSLYWKSDKIKQFPSANGHLVLLTQQCCLLRELIYANHAWFLCFYARDFGKNHLQVLYDIGAVKNCKKNFLYSFFKQTSTATSTTTTCNFIKKLQHWCFPVNLNNFFKTAFSTLMFSLYWVLSKELQGSERQQSSKVFKNVNQFKKQN